MSKKIYIWNVIFISLIWLIIYQCNGQIPINTQELHMSTQELNTPNDSFDKINKLITAAKNSGFSDEETTKLLIAYSILNKMSKEEIQQFALFPERENFSNETRSIELADAIIAAKSSNSDTVLWFCSCTTLIAIICVLIVLSQNRSSKVGKAVDDAIENLAEASQNAAIKLNQFFYNTKSKIHNFFQGSK